MTSQNIEHKAIYHLPGLFEFYELYKVFFPLYKSHPEYFYEWCEIGSVYGAPADCLWGGGRVGFGDNDPIEVLNLMKEYKISARLTFSNSLLEERHLADKRCNNLCRLFNDSCDTLNGAIVHSDLLAQYIMDKYPNLYLVSSTTKVITDFDEMVKEASRDIFKFIVPDFRLNKKLDQLKVLPEYLKEKLEFLCNECCDYGCTERRDCYLNVSRKALMVDCDDHICRSSNAKEGYRFSKAMENQGFISINDICDIYLKEGLYNFKIEGRSLGSAVIFEFLLYYMTKPEHQLKVRENIYLDSMLDLF